MGKSFWDVCLDEVDFGKEGIDYLIKRTDFNAKLMLNLAKEYNDCTFQFSVAEKNGVELSKYMWIMIKYPKEEK